VAEKGWSRLLKAGLPCFSLSSGGVTSWIELASVLNDWTAAFRLALRGSPWSLPFYAERVWMVALVYGRCGAGSPDALCARSGLPWRVDYPCQGWYDSLFIDLVGCDQGSGPDPGVDQVLGGVVSF